MSRKLPALESDEAAEALLERDLSDFISAENLAPFPFEFRPKQKTVNLRMSVELLEAIRTKAKRQGIPYQRYIRQTLEQSLTEKPKSGAA